MPYILLMKILLISKDKDLINICLFSNQPWCEDIIIYNNSFDPLEVLSHSLQINPAILIVDDDFLKPETEHILRSIKNIKKEILTVFVTSDNSMQLGRKISRLGIQLYAIKPLTDKIMIESIQSLIQVKKRQYQ